MSFADCNEDDEGILRNAPSKWCLQGDPYQEPDVVVRGVAMGEDMLADVMGMEAVPLKASVDGDYYHGEKKDPMRNVGPVGSELIFLQDAQPMLAKEPLMGLSEPRFSKEAQPFEMNDGLVPQQSTTVVIECPSPDAIGNSLLHFLETSVDASIKVHPERLGILAEVFYTFAPTLDYSVCSIRIRVYKDKKTFQRWQCEFTRQRGDSMGFARFFLEARKWLQERFDVDYVPPLAVAPFEALSLPSRPTELDTEEDLSCIDDLLDLPDMDDMEEAGLLPLYDMAASAAGCPALQAEFAGTIAAMAQDVDRVNLLCTDRAFKEIAELVKSSHMDIAYLTACCLKALAELADRQKVERYFVQEDGSLLFAMLTMVGKGDKPWKLVQRRTAEAFAVAIDRYSKALSRDASEKLVGEVEKMLQKELDSARSDLERAKRMLIESY
mmetsp:Transcript_57424/g.134674  ORF Transcript_57424/g.134674 Transcript_57424/m.134674 type:complete len:439 (-) Transcript_57424:92-1408(-)